MHQFIFQLTIHTINMQNGLLLDSSHCGREIKAGYLFDIASQISVVLDPRFGHILTEKALDRRVSLPSIP